MRLLVILSFSALVLAGCRHSNPPKDPLTEFKGKQAKTERAATARPKTTPSAQPPPKPLPRVTPLNEFSGKVVSVNAPLRFAVFEFFLTAMPAAEQRLGIYRQGQKVGEAKITGPSRDHNTVADITVGEAKVGDDVRSD